MKLVITFLIVSLSMSANSQIVGTDAFLKGIYIEVGIYPNGALGSEKYTPAGYHPNYYTGSLAVVADVDRDGWTLSKTGRTAYMGDFIAPGGGQELWGIKILNEECVALKGSLPTGGLTGSNTAVYKVGSKNIARWEGAFSDLNIRQEASVDSDKLEIQFEITLKNVGTKMLRNIFYHRMVDPDNEQPWTGLYATHMKIDDTIGGGSLQAQVSAIGDDYQSYFGVLSKDVRAKVYFLDADLLVKKAIDSIYDGTLSTPTYYHSGLGDTLYKDVSMGVIFKIDSLNIGDSTLITYTYAFGTKKPIAHLISERNTYYTGDTIFACENTAAIVELHEKYGFCQDWSWNLSPNLKYSDSSFNIIAVNGFNKYTIISGSSGSCAPDDTFILYVKAYPFIAPKIKQSGSILSIDNIYKTYNWVRDGAFVYLEYSPSINATIPGEYYIRVRDSNNCIFNSDTVYIDDVTASINSISSTHGFNIYPNPNVGTFTISSALATKDATIKIYNLVGNVIYKENVHFKNNEAIIKLNAASGIYLIELTDSQSNKWRERILKE